MDEETTFKFIETVHGHECLWSVTSKAYKNKVLRDDLWQKVGETFKMKGEDAYALFRKLREKYRREADKNNGRSGAAASQPSKWVFLKSLQFLDEAYKKRKTSNSQEWGEDEVLIELLQSDEENHNPSHVTPIKSNERASTAPSARKDRSRSKTPAANCSNIIDAMQSTTKNIINAFQPRQMGPDDDIVQFVKGTLNAVTAEDRENYKQDIMELSMKYRFKNKRNN